MHTKASLLQELRALLPSNATVLIDRKSVV